MLAPILAWLATHDGPWAYVVIGLASLIEYVFPPFPGDSVALFGVFLATSAGLSGIGVYLALDVGAVLGGLGAYAVGRRFAEPSSRPTFLRTPSAEAALRDITARFERYGGLYLATNRFVPALRAFFFVGAGVARVPVWQVVVYGGLSAAAWNAILFALGWLAGSNFDRLEAWVSRYATVVVIAVVVGVLAALWKRRRSA